MEQDFNLLFQFMYEEYQGPMRTIARRCGIPFQEIDDVIQESFISYYQHYPLTWNSKNKKSMLVRILKNKCVDYFRKNHDSDNISLDESEENMATEVLIQCVSKDALDFVLKDERYQEIKDCITGMRQDWKDVVILRIVQGLPTNETCEILGITGTACRSRLSKARKYMRDVLGSSYYSC